METIGYLPPLEPRRFSRRTVLIGIGSVALAKLLQSRLDGLVEGEVAQTAEQALATAILNQEQEGQSLRLLRNIRVKGIMSANFMNRLFLTSLRFCQRIRLMSFQFPKI